MSIDNSKWKMTTTGILVAKYATFKKYCEYLNAL